MMARRIAFLLAPGLCGNGGAVCVSVWDVCASKGKSDVSALPGVAIRLLESETRVSKSAELLRKWGMNRTLFKRIEFQFQSIAKDFSILYYGAEVLFSTGWLWNCSN